MANAYGITPRAQPKVADSPKPKADGAPSAVSARPAVSAKASGIPLSSVLNDEERAYFDQLEAMGPITYGRTGKGGMVPEAPRGVRLDVRG